MRVHRSARAYLPPTRLVCAGRPEFRPRTGSQIHRTPREHAHLEVARRKHRRVLSRFLSHIHMHMLYDVPPPPRMPPRRYRYRLRSTCTSSCAFKHACTTVAHHRYTLITTTIARCNCTRAVCARRSRQSSIATHTQLSLGRQILPANLAIASHRGAGLGTLISMMTVGPATGSMVNLCLLTLVLVPVALFGIADARVRRVPRSGMPLLMLDLHVHDVNLKCVCCR